MVNSIGKPTDTYVSTSSIDELRAQHEIAKCLKVTDQALVKLETAVQSDIKDQAEMQQAQKCAALFHRVADSIVMNRIFSFLPLENLARISRVSKRWNKYASYRSLWNSSAMCKQFCKLNILDEDTWKTHVDLEKFGLETDDVPPLDKRAIIPTLKRLMALPIEDNRRITLLTIPKGLTLNKLAEIVKAPKKGNALDGIDRVIDIRDYINQIPGNKACLKTYRVAITNVSVHGVKKMVIAICFAD